MENANEPNLIEILKEAASLVIDQLRKNGAVNVLVAISTENEAFVQADASKAFMVSSAIKILRNCDSLGFAIEIDGDTREIHDIHLGGNEKLNRLLKSLLPQKD